MGTTGVIRIGRQELYERVCSTPMMDKLLADAEAWRRADTVRGYVRAEDQFAADRGINPGEGTDLGAWLRWAREQAEKLDPVQVTLNRLAATPEARQ
jgi:hypothetical protein